MVKLLSQKLVLVILCTTVSAAEPGPADPDAPTEFIETASGLKYRVLRKGEGDPPTEKSTVKVHYKGWLADGTAFDSSYERDAPVDFPLQAVIPGWTEGVQLVSAGGMIELEVPSRLGYGQRGVPPKIPGDATLHFLIELIEFKTPLSPRPPDPNAPVEFTTADSGVKYRMLRKGNGRKPRETDSVQIHYKAWLDGNREIDSTYKTGGPLAFPWNRLLDPGNDVLQHLSEGGMIEIEIPGELQLTIPGAPKEAPLGATVHFLIELEKIEAPK